jgi:hypothetical protein
MPRSISHLALWCGLLALVVTGGGCQRGPTWNLAPVEGTITKDGRPLAGLEVIFLADVEFGTQGPKTSGLTDTAGHYELRTDAGDRGAAIGRHRVCLYVPEKRDPLPEKSDRLRGRNRTRQAKLPKDKAAKAPMSDGVQLPPAYGRFAETPLRVEVEPGSQVIDLDVK